MVKLTRHATRISCLVELSTGVPLVLVPSVVMALLFGSPLADGGDQLAQLFGAALISLGISCWSAGDPEAKPSTARLCLHRRSAGPHGWPRWLAASRAGAVDAAGSIQVSGTAETHVTGCRVEGLAHQGRRPEAMAVVLSAEEGPSFDHPPFLLFLRNGVHR